jgi:hypothetical protein
LRLDGTVPFYEFRHISECSFCKRDWHALTVVTKIQVPTQQNTHNHRYKFMRQERKSLTQKSKEHSLGLSGIS